MDNNIFGNISFDLPKNQSNVIKVIGVGGGGSNAINHMFQQGIVGVDFVVCNTDSQALKNSSVPNKVQLGVTLTEGLGAGAKPEVGQQAALESIEDIEKLLDSNTKMVFITAGMGGGTGTGAAPVIAQLAKERGILTVGIVTIPFQFEGRVRNEQAMAGIERMRKQVDSLIVINNNKLREVYGNLGFQAGFAKADEVLAIASKGIAEVITKHLTINIDLKDAESVLRDSGTAIMGSSRASGVDRAKDAIAAALDSPLLNDNKIYGAKNVLLLITFGKNEITFDEMDEINQYIQDEAGHGANIIMGAGFDEAMGDDEVSVMVVATGFNSEQQSEIVNAEPKKIIHNLDNEQKVTQTLSTFGMSSVEITKTPEVVVNEIANPILEEEQKVVFNLEETDVENTANDLIPTTEYIKNLDVFFEIVENEVPKSVSPIEQSFNRFSQPVQMEKRDNQDLNEVEVPQFEVKKPIFEFLTNPINEIEVIDPIFVKADEVSFEVDLFTTAETNDINVNNPIHVMPITEHTEQGKIVHVLEDEIDFEPAAKVTEPVVQKVSEPEMDITVRNEELDVEKMLQFEVNPIEMSVEDVLKLRAEARKQSMKDFNYKFNNPNRLDELEKEPAYKRSGVELNAINTQTNQSRLSIDLDSNNDPQLRNNNSYLHDNVD